MDLDTYQELAMKTATYSEKYKIIYPVLGLNGEAGEVAEKVKKLIRDKNEELDIHTRVAIMKELGDVLWYLAATAQDLGINLNTIADNNLKKLADRNIRGKIQGEGDNR